METSPSGLGADGQALTGRPLARSRPTRFVLLVYRMPPTPTAGRVAVWRLLKKIGAIYLQQSLCAFPDNARLRHDLEPVLRRIEESQGEYHLLPLRKLTAEEDAKLADQFLEQTEKHYAEIVENCEVNFTKEVEFETFRKNFTYEEAEEIRAEYEKITSWFERVRERDWFMSPREADARAWIDRCRRLLEEFEARVFETQERLGNAPGLIVGRTARPRRTPVAGRRDRSRSAGR